MIRHLFLAICIVGMALSGISATLQPHEALARFMLSKQHKLASSSVGTKLLFTRHDDNGEPTMYVFNLNGNDGYVVISADDAIVPLLGYSEHGLLNPNDLPPALNYWLGSYSRQVAALRNDTVYGGGYTGVSLPSDWTPIEPLLSTKWNQTEPYNDSCPIYNKERSVTGCVATAMAQAMNYFKYPEVGRDSISFHSNSINQNLKFNFEKHPFDWDNMLDEYIPGEYDDTQAAAVAELMLACGMAVQMDYSPLMSGAYSQNIADAMIKYFNYDSATSYLTRDDYSYSQWAELIYNNLKNVGPVIYDGQAPLQGGHSFVCDGYDGNGYFHFNWGWAGLSDGYFLLDVLAPEAIGTGGYFGGFSLMQDIILGIQPPTEKKPEKTQKRAIQYGLLFGEMNDSALCLGAKDGTINGWGYVGEGTAHFKFGAIVKNIDNPTEPIFNLTSINFSDTTIKSGKFLRYRSAKPESSPKFDIKQLSQLTPNQRYKFIFATQDLDWTNETGLTADWIEVKVDYSYPNYIIISRDDNGAITIENQGIPMFSISNIVVPEKAYYNEPLSLCLDISNPTDIELSRNICAIIAHEETMSAFISDSFLLTLAPYQTITYKWDALLTRILGLSNAEGAVYELAFFDIGSEEFYDTESVFITMGNRDTSVEQLADESNLTLYFNPTTKSLSIISAHSIANLSAISTNGLTVKLPTDTNNVNLNKLAKGIWLIKATDSEGISKIIKINIS